MAAPPLSHHEILELVGPYARQRLQVDLQALGPDPATLLRQVRAIARRRTWCGLSVSPRRGSTNAGSPRAGKCSCGALPVLTVLSVIGVALVLPRVPITGRPGLVTVIFRVPIALIALTFALQ